MAPKKSHKKVPSPSKSSIHRSGSTNGEASQEIEGQVYQNFVSRLQGQIAERRARLHQETSKAHRVRMSEVTASIKKTFEKHDRDKRALRRPGVERLAILFQRRQIIDNELGRLTTELEHAFFASARQLQLAMSGRVEELNRKH